MLNHSMALKTQGEAGLSYPASLGVRERVVPPKVESAEPDPEMYEDGDEDPEVGSSVCPGRCLVTVGLLSQTAAL